MWAGGKQKLEEGDKKPPASTAEVWRRRTMQWFKQYGVWVDLVSALLSLLAVLLYVVETYSTEEERYGRLFGAMEIGLAFFFLKEWLVRFWISEHRVNFAFSFDSFIDFVTIAPAFLGLIKAAGVDVAALAANLQFFRVLRALRILRVLRIMRVYRLFDQSGDPSAASDLNRELFTLAFMLICIIFCTAGFVHWAESTTGGADASHIAFHDALYLAIITVTTVGYGDIVPTTGLARLGVVIGLLAFFFVIPFQTARVTDIMATTSVHARTAYGAGGRVRRHVVLAGAVADYSAVRGFLAEFFARGEARDERRAVVLLSPEAPSEELKRLLRRYNVEDVARVTYCQGSPLIEADRRRAAVGTAAACFILADVRAADPTGEDRRSVLYALAAKRHWQGATKKAAVEEEVRALGSIAAREVALSEDEIGDAEMVHNATPPRRVGGYHSVVEGEGDAAELPVLVQVVAPEAAGHLLAAMPPDAGLEDHFMCLDELRLNLVGAGLLCPGLSTLVANLCRSTFLPPGMSGFSDQPTALKALLGGGLEPWHEEYIEGVCQEVMCVALPTAFEGALFEEAVLTLYHSLGAILFALLPADGVGPGGVWGDARIILAPNKKRICNTPATRGFVVVPNVAVGRAVEFFDGPLNPLPRAAAAGSSAPFLKNSRSTGFAAGSGVTSESRTSQQQGTSRISSEVELSAMRVVSGSSSSPLAKNLPSLLSASPGSYSGGALRSALLPGLLENAQGLRGHVIMCGELRRLSMIIAPLRQARLTRLRPVLVVAPHVPSDEDWGPIAALGMAYFLQGSPAVEADLIRLNVTGASALVLLANLKDTAGKGVAEAMAADVESVFAYQHIRRAAPNLLVTVELAEGTNLAFFSQSAMHPALGSNPFFCDMFASGAISTASMLDPLVVQSFYERSMLPVLRALVASPCGGQYFSGDGQGMPSVARVIDSDSAPKKQMGSPAAAGYIVLVPVPPALADRPYSDLFTAFVADGGVPLGLYRMSSGGQGTPYVFTNPHGSTHCRQEDSVYVLSLREACWTDSHHQATTGNGRHAIAPGTLTPGPGSSFESAPSILRTRSAPGESSVLEALLNEVQALRKEVAGLKEGGTPATQDTPSLI